MADDVRRAVCQAGPGDANTLREAARITGALIEPDDGIMAVGSGATDALAAARALVPDERLDARMIVERNMQIASETCVFSNCNVTNVELGVA